MAIKIFVTGGTFDKEYDMINGSFHFKETHLPEILEIGRSNIDAEIETLMMIDSLEMTDKDREYILHKCSSSSEDKIVITHGTDTMPITAQALSDAKLEKTIVLTGAMIPYKFGASDGFFNLGAALAFVQSLPKGVYITMNGKFFRAGNVKKNKKTGFFEEIAVQAIP